MKEKESIISKQERAAKQQELLEKKRRAKAEYNTSSVKPVRGMTQRAPLRKETEKPAAGAVKKPDVPPEKSRHLFPQKNGMISQLKINCLFLRMQPVMHPSASGSSASAG